MTLITKKNSKFILIFFSFLIFLVGNKFIFNKFNFCLTTIEYNIEEKEFDALEKSEKKKIINYIDKQNIKVKNYLRFNHEIIGTSSNKNECKENIELILINLENIKKMETNFIKNIKKAKEVDVRNLFNLLFIILIFSFLKLLQNLFRLFQSKIIFNKN